jgi:hypothetical protein
MPVSDRMQRNIDGSDSRRLTASFTFDVTAEENLYLLAITSHYRQYRKGHAADS